jgi:hypothetical protein
MRRKVVSPQAPRTGVLLEAAIQHVVGALMSLATWWMDPKVRLLPEQINQIFLELTLPGLKTTSAGG